MSSDTAFNIIESFIKANWDTKKCPLAWDNEPFDPPSSEDANARWAKIFVDGEQWEQQSIGEGGGLNELWNETGSVLFVVLVPVNTGSRLCRQTMREFADLCRGEDIGMVEFLGCRFDPIGRTDDDGVWWSMTVTVDWRRQG